MARAERELLREVSSGSAAWKLGGTKLEKGEERWNEFRDTLRYERNEIKD